MVPEAEFDAPDIIALPSSELTPKMRDVMLGLFHASYHRANDSYLETSLRTFSRTAIAFDGEGNAVAFATGDTRTLDIPRLGPQIAHLAGLACVHREWRRHGLFTTVATATFQRQEVLDPSKLLLVAGRVAHPASLRSFALPNAVPRPGLTPSPWHQEVGAVVARAYGSAGFDGDHFVCIGAGRGPGDPALDIENVTEDEIALFASVNRARGDALLRAGWFPYTPAGW